MFRPESPKNKPAAYSRDGSTNVADFLLELAPSGQTALCLLDRDYTYGELRHATNTVASYLLSIGRQRGDRVMLVADNSFFWVAAYLGIMRAGLVCVPVPPTISSKEFARIFDCAEAEVVFAQAGIAGKLAGQLGGAHLVTDAVSPALGTRPYAMLELLASVGEIYECEVQRVQARDLAALMFTSGSTAQPRGVMVSHGNIIANTEAIIQALHLTGDDRMLVVLPFHYCFGTSLLHTHLRVGGTLVIDPRFAYPELVLRRMIETECTGFAGVPSHFQILLRNSILRRKAFPHLRHVQQAGGRLAPPLIHELRQALPGKRIYIMYGQTEATARLSYLPPELLDAKTGSIGKGIPGVSLRVLKPSGEEARAGETGEIVAEGPNVALGYWRDPEASAATFRDGKLYTGDIATVDSEGFLYVVDRAKDFIKCGGRRVSSSELEERLLAFDEVLEAAVVGVPDDILGEAVKAFVVPRNRDDAFLMRLRTFCKTHLPPQWVPRETEIVSCLPKNSAGKLMRNRLRTDVWGPASEANPVSPLEHREDSHTSL